MKKIYSKLIIILMLSIFLIVIFYLSSTIKSTIKIATRDLALDNFIKEEVELSRQDFKDYKINDKILKSNLFLKFKDYKYNGKIEKGREDIFYKEQSEVVQ